MLRITHPSSISCPSVSFALLSLPFELPCSYRLRGFAIKTQKRFISGTFKQKAYRLSPYCFLLLSSLCSTFAKGMFMIYTIQYWVFSTAFTLSVAYLFSACDSRYMNAILGIPGILFSGLITAVITDSIKVSVGQPRPSFFWRCFPDGKAVFDAITNDVVCHGDEKVIKEGYKSFPSGHTSWSFAGLAFLAWYLAGKIRMFDRRGHIAKLCLVLLPLLLAAFVGVSRVQDYRHHWQDVFAGGLIGITVASICYLLLFPFPHQAGWAPHAYFEMLSKTEGTSMEEDYLRMLQPVLNSANAESSQDSTLNRKVAQDTEC